MATETARGYTVSKDPLLKRLSYEVITAATAG